MQPAIVENQASLAKFEVIWAARYGIAHLSQLIDWENHKCRTKVATPARPTRLGRSSALFTIWLGSSGNALASEPLLNTGPRDAFTDSRTALLSVDGKRLQRTNSFGSRFNKVIQEFGCLARRRYQ